MTRWLRCHPPVSDRSRRHSSRTAPIARVRDACSIRRPRWAGVIRRLICELPERRSVRSHRVDVGRAAAAPCEHDSGVCTANAEMDGAIALAGGNGVGFGLLRRTVVGVSTQLEHQGPRWRRHLDGVIWRQCPRRNTRVARRAQLVTVYVRPLGALTITRSVPSRPGSVASQAPNSAASAKGSNVRPCIMLSRICRVCLNLRLS